MKGATSQREVYIGTRTSISLDAVENEELCKYGAKISNKVMIRVENIEIT